MSEHEILMQDSPLVELRRRISTLEQENERLKEQVKELAVALKDCDGAIYAAHSEFCVGGCDCHERAARVIAALAHYNGN